MKEFIIAQIVPTGVHADIGGYVGDAMPATNLLASIADTVISHPNVINGVTLDVAKDNILYVEGFMLDRFFKGEIGLRDVRENKIGVVLDFSPHNKKGFELAINTIDTIRTVKGIDILEYVKTEKAVNALAVKTKTGAYVGEIKDPNVFLKPVKKLIEDGANAIAIATEIRMSRPKDLELYFKGKCANPYGGTEAIISHTISRRFDIPCAHAPLLTEKEIEKEMFSGIVDPRAGAEAIGPAYLGCVLQGLHKAPQPVQRNKANEDDILVKDVCAVVVPYTCMGGVPALAAQKNKIPIIAVKENKTLMKVSPEKLKFEDVIVVENYLEAAGVIATMKEGIDHQMVRRPIRKLRKLV